VLLAKRRELTRSQAPDLSYADWYKTTIPDHYSFPRHIEFLCGIAQKVIDGEMPKVAISTPPGHTKSDTITRRLPNYYGPRNPGKAIVLTGYSQRFAEKNLSYPARELARELGTLAQGASAMDEWEFSNGARLLARGVGIPPTGINPIGLLVADDPISSRADALSEVERENVWDWWRGSIVQRFWPDTKALVIATRWHEDDLIGRLKAESDGWVFINLPAIAQEDDPLGRKPGEALWPEAKPIEFLENIKREIGDYEFEALFQGNPTPPDGAIINREWLKKIPLNEIPPIDTWVRYWDIAVSEKQTADYTVGALIGFGADQTIYLRNITRFRANWPQACEHIASISETEYEQFKASKQNYHVGIDARMSQQGFVQDLFTKGIFKHVSLWPDTSRGDKVQRASGWAARARFDKFRMVSDVTWNQDFINECLAFPLGKHDDQIDAVSGGYQLLWTLRGGAKQDEKTIKLNTHEFYTELGKRAGVR
jgi:predicted phage terminase large subunit-like protein